MAAKTTQDRILDSADKLFSDNGFGGTSLRQITSGAGVNLAAVNYHFGSKDALIQAVFHRLLGPVNESRLARLDALEAESAAPAACDIIRSFLEPAMELYRTSGRGPLLVRLFGRLYSEPGGTMMQMFVSEFREVFRRYHAALSKALPQADGTELLWRFHFMVGAMAHTVAHRELMQSMSPQGCQLGDRDETLERLVVFVSAGFEADNALVTKPAATGRSTR